MAADLLSQAEHDELASAILVTTSMELAEKVSEEAERVAEELSRSEIIKKSLDNYGYILVADTMADAIRTVNEIAPEHLEIVTKNAFEDMTRIRNAGAIFILSLIHIFLGSISRALIRLLMDSGPSISGRILTVWCAGLMREY